MNPTRLLASLVIAATLAATSHAQTKPINIDANTLNDIRTLPGPFPVQTGDNPHFADPTFDDSTWPRFTTRQRFSAPAGTYFWVRVHLHILNPRGPLAITVRHFYYPYTVYANGQQIATSASMPAHALQVDPPFTIALPQTNDITLAIRFYLPANSFFLPLSGLQIGPLATVAASTELNRIHIFDDRYAFALILSIVTFAFAGFSLILYLAQRHRSEYLWLALCCFCLASYSADSVGVITGTLTGGTLGSVFNNLMGYYLCLCAMEFIIRFVGAKRRWPVLLLELVLLLGPVAFFLPGNFANYTLVFAISFWFAVLTYYLIQAFRSGNVENKLLLPPFALLGLISAWEFSSYIFLAVHFPQPIRIGRIGVDLSDLSILLLLAGILAVVLYRFIRVTKDEQRSAAELEAARTIQQILIPEILPTIHGYVIASVYQPAQEVGGDFFQIIPLPANAALIILGDVSGKGLQAAMTVSLLVGALRAAAETTASPAELLANLNRRLHGRGTGFTTCVILHIGLAGNITASNAGHLHPYLDGQEFALETGLPLGFLPDSTYDESHFNLACSQTLTLLTDGIVEATSPTKELFGFDRTQSICTQSAQHIAATATAFGHPTPQADDITVLTLHRLPA